MGRKLTWKEKLSRSFCGRRELDKKAMKLKRCLDEIQDVLNKCCK